MKTEFKTTNTSFQ